VDVCAGRNLWKEEFAKRQSERVAHGVNEDVWYHEIECVPGEDQTAEALSEKCEMGPFRGKNKMPRAEIKKGNTRGIEIDIEAIFDIGQHRILVDIMIASINDTKSLWILSLRRPNGRPKDTFSPTTSVTDCC